MAEKWHGYDIGHNTCSDCGKVLEGGIAYAPNEDVAISGGGVCKTCIPSGTKPGPEPETLGKMTVAGLQKLAKKHGIELPDKAPKATLIELLSEAGVKP